MDGHLGAPLAIHASRRGAAPAIVGERGVIPHAQFHRMVTAAAGAALRAGIEPGATVALRVEDRPHDLALLFGLLRIGAPLVLIGAADTPAQVAAILDRVGTRTLLRMGARGPDDPPGTIVLGPSDFDREDPALPPAPAPGDVCIIQRSGGTTAGEPKLVAATHAAEHDRLVTTALSGPDDRYLRVISMGFTGGMRRAISSLLVGGAIVLGPPYRAVDDFVGVARGHGATWTIMVPSQLRDLLRRVTAGPILPGLRIRTGSAMLSPQERLDVMARLSPDLHVDYGANEVWLLATAGPDDIRDRPGTVGRALPGTTIEIVDADGVPVPAGTVGAIRARRPSFATGYLHGGSRGASRFAEGWFYTGDAGHLDRDGFLYLAGRLDDLINVGALKVFPAEIEAALTADPRVAEALAVGVPTAGGGVRPWAAVVLRAPVEASALRARCIAALGRERAPDGIVVVPALPRTPVGKPDARALRLMLEARAARPKDGPAG
ncbi:MAG: class I adenylate-forming enzyme family protein [Alphaproteobacteria bacterium]